MRTRETVTISMPPDTRDRLDKAAQLFANGNRSAYARRAVEQAARRDFRRLANGGQEDDGDGE